MDGHALNGDGIVGVNNPTLLDQRDFAIPVKDTPMVRRKPEEPGPDEKTALFPRLPSQKIVDAAYLINQIGWLGTAFVFLSIGVVGIMPWIGTNVVIPVVNSGTRFVENMSETNKSFASMAADSLEEKRNTRAMRESTTEVLKEVKEAVRILSEKK